MSLYSFDDIRSVGTPNVRSAAAFAAANVGCSALSACTVLRRHIYVASAAILARRSMLSRSARLDQLCQAQYLQLEHRCSSQRQMLRPWKPRAAVHMALRLFQTIASHGQERRGTSIRGIRQ